MKITITHRVGIKGSLPQMSRIVCIHDGKPICIIRSDFKSLNNKYYEGWYSDLGRFTPVSVYQCNVTEMVYPIRFYVCVSPFIRGECIGMIIR